MNTKDDAQQSAKVPAMTEKERATYAAQLKEARIRQGLKQSEVAEQAGIARNTYARMENGTQVPQAEKLWAAMLVLDLQPQADDPEWLQEWWAVLKPLIMQLPKETRGLTMGRIVGILANAIQGGESTNGVGLKAANSPEPRMRVVTEEEIDAAVADQPAAKDAPGWREETDQ